MIPHSQPYISHNQIDLVNKSLEAAMVSSGARTMDFEVAHANLIGKRFGIACGSGTQGLVAILKELNIGKGDEVILPSYVCEKVAEGIIFVGAKPVLCDIETSWVMTPNSVRPHISTKTKAIILVHIFGIDAWDNNFNKFGVPIIEDICQALGRFDGQKGPGSYTDWAFTSFHGTKVITTGQGGMAFSNSIQSSQAIRRTIKNVFLNDFSDLQAALGLAQLSEFKYILQRRKTISEVYLTQLPEHLIIETKNLNTMFFRFPIKFDGDWEIIKMAFEQLNISVRKGVDCTIHGTLGVSKEKFIETEKIFRSTISLPILPQMTDEDIAAVVKACKVILC